jgi:hypothetical protein
VRLPRDFRRCPPAYQALRSCPNLKRLPWSSSRRSENFLKRHLHSPGMLQFDSGRRGALAARMRNSSSALTAAQHRVPVTILTAGNFLGEFTGEKRGRPQPPPPCPSGTFPSCYSDASPPSTVARQRRRQTPRCGPRMRGRTNPSPL